MFRNKKDDSTEESSDSDSDADSTDQSDDPAEKGSNWSLFRKIWPIKDRPKDYRDKEVMNRAPIEKINALITLTCKKPGEADNDSREYHHKDEKVQTTKFPEQKDNGSSRLHSARWLGSHLRI